MTEVIASIFFFLGAFFVLVGTLGLLRFPDVRTRMHAAGLASTLGICSLLVGSLVFFNWVDHTFSVKELLLIGFLLLTSPVATHMILQAAHKTGVTPWEGHVVDELGEKDADS